MLRVHEIGTVLLQDLENCIFINDISDLWYKIIYNIYLSYTFWIWAVPLENRVMIALISSPFSIDTMRIWSSSLTQTKKFLASLW